MSNRERASGLLVGLVLLAFWWGWSSSMVESRSPSTAPDVASTRERAVRLQPSALGTGSCAAGGCHGSSAAKLESSLRLNLSDPSSIDCWKSSYLQWANRDRHAQAFHTLESDRSQQMMTKLGSSKQASEDQRCLACHANPTLAARTDIAAKHLQREGVSCEACHGNASEWLAPHTGWPADLDRTTPYASLKMTPLFNPRIRAETCAGCHIGAPASAELPLRDVNHDLIAAGHPRLDFEFTNYLRNMPRHWREKDRTKSGSLRKRGFEADFWALGQAACAEASLRLLKSRVSNKKAWPELAEFNCYACHRQVGDDGSPPSAGSLVWNRPYAFQNADSDSVLREALKRTSDVAAEMPRLRELADVDLAIAAWRNRSGSRSLAVLIEEIRPNEQQWQELNWDQAARLYTAVVAIDNARHDRAFAESAEPILAELHQLLRLEREPDRFDSPRTFNRKEVRAAFQKWFDVVAPTKATRGKPD